MTETADTFEALGVKFSASDLRGAGDAFEGTHRDPSRRGDRVTEEYLADMQAAATLFVNAAEQHPNRTRQIAAALEQYRVGYLARVRRYLGAHSGILSYRIVGKTDDRKNARQYERAQQYLDELYQYRATRLSRLLRTLIPRAEKLPIEVVQAREAVARLEAEQERMKAANKAARRKGGPDVAALEALGYTTVEIKRMLTRQSWEKPGFQSFELTSIAGKIKRAREKAETLEARTVAEAREYEIAGVAVEEDPRDNRIRLTFPDRVNDVMYERLKAAGWRWAPSYGAWQRQLTDSARQSARYILGAA